MSPVVNPLPPPLRIIVPDGNRYPDSFYRAVAMAYYWHAYNGDAPAVELSNELGVPATTCHRWFKEARRRGLMPPGHRGRAGS